ncbi:tRNA pseudouridine(55) synthase TruB [Marmoricola sp. RAF53]|uniref:tRNA pseudouridine(55) synthase TruB n=1 Tax=Marmoricola sp. RAF53 TaxID=3233059 RepID=UPI003F94A1E4
MSKGKVPGPGGLVVVDKPAGVTSHDVVARVRRLAGTRKVGHAGTLDPMATGVLVIGVERATRLLGHLLLTDKTYDATIRLGSATTTDDAEGEVVSTSPTDGVDEDAVRAGLAAMVGEIDQVPSAVSAIKVDGRRAYDRVRAGETVELAARTVRIDEITVHRYAPGPDGIDVDVTVRCSSGTYIRAIARDLGSALGVGGHLTALRRTAVGEFDLGVARTLEELAEAEDFWSTEVLPIAAAARRTFPAYELDATQAALVRVGRKLPLDLPAEGPVAVFAPDGEFLALYELGGALARPVAVFV